MIVTLIGAGAHRLLSTTRRIFAEDVFANGGELRLYDLNAPRAEVMSRMIQKSPEYARTPVPVRWDLSLEQALNGADVVSVTLLAGPASVLEEESLLCRGNGFLGSDNISYSGAFLALRGAPILLNIAHKMEQLCPKAVLLDFANPVGVLSGMVNMFTRIRCVGICEGHMNHYFDLNRILNGCNDPEPDIETLVAGVNHASFIVRGTMHGQDLHSLMAARLESTPDWYDRIKFPKTPHPLLRFGLEKQVQLFRERGVLLFSSEMDGFSHYFHEEALRLDPTPALDADGDLTAEERAQMDKSNVEALEERRQANIRFAEYAKMDSADLPWDSKTDYLFRVYEKTDVTSRIMRGLAGVGTTRVAVSDLNRGAIGNMDPGFSMEYTHTVDRDGIHPVMGAEVPTSVYGMTAMLASHQTLLAKACGTGDPADLKTALLAYPFGFDTARARVLWKHLLHTSEPYIAKSLQGLKDIL